MATKALTYNDAADLYDQQHTGRRARTLPMHRVIAWLEHQPNIRYCKKKDEFYHQKIKETVQ